MAAVTQPKVVGPLFSNEIEVINVSWDFAKDGGGIGALDLLTAGADVVVHSCIAKAKTAVTSSDAITFTVGGESAADLVASTFKVALGAKAVVDSKKGAVLVKKDTVIKMTIGA